VFASYSYRLNQVLRDNFLLDSTTDKIIEIYLIVNTVKPVYNSQPRGITEVTFVDRWPLFGASDILFLREVLKLVLVDRKQLLTGDL